MRTESLFAYLLLVIARFGLLSIYLTVLGCIPATLGTAAAMSDSAASTAVRRHEFREDFEERQAEREANGLEPLDWCNEVWKYDKAWVKLLEECKDRRVFYGDPTPYNPEEEDDG